MSQTLVLAGKIEDGMLSLARTVSEQSGNVIVDGSSQEISKALADAGITCSASGGALSTMSTDNSILYVGMEGCNSHITAAVRGHAHAGGVVIVDNQDAPTVAGYAKQGVPCISARLKKRLAAKALRAAAHADTEAAAALEKESGAKVLVVGSGGREHAIALKMAESPQVERVYVGPGNGGTAGGHWKLENVPSLGAEDVPGVVAFCRENDIALVAVGPEAPLVIGMVDALQAAGVPAFGPTEAAAQLEASKAFSKDFMTKCGVRTAEYRNFTDPQAAIAYIESISHKVVVKASGLAAGKGVIMSETKEEAIQAVKDMMMDQSFGSAGSEIVIEEWMEGPEVSCLSFCDGNICVGMPPAQDHKRALDGDRGLNTGGMGAYAPAPVCPPAVHRECLAMMQKVVDRMRAEGKPYQGCLYGGFMLTATGPSILEFNCRFGDPETQVVLPLLKSDLFEVMLACAEGRLAQAAVEWHPGAAATVVCAAPGYPNAYPKGLPIGGLAEAGGGDGRGAHFREALRRAYAGVNRVQFEGLHRRTDIGHRALSAPVRLGVLGSTRGSDLQPILEAIQAGELNAEVALVVSNKADAYILERARLHGVPARHIDGKGKKRAEFDAEVTAAFRDVGVQLVLCIGYMRILSPQFCQAWADRCLNVHPSLLPEFAGGMDLAVHKAVLDAGRPRSGCTVHWVTEEVDGGGIVVQEACEVAPGETPESLKAKVQALEGGAFIKAIELFREGKIGPEAKGLSYKDAGVDIDAGNELIERIKPACRSTRRPGCDADLGGFGGLFDLAAAGHRAEDTILVGATDGVGTKLRIAQDVGQHDGVGVDLVAMCVNDLIVQGAEPLFFLDYYATGALSVAEAAAVVEGIAEGCRQSNCGLIGGETAEMPSMYAPGEYDLAGFAVGAVRRGAMRPLPLRPGDAVLGLASSGVHSNGFSLVRKVLAVAGLGFSAPAPFAPGRSLADVLLTPTRIYVRALMPLMDKIKALAHITGGGLPENVPRVLAADTAVRIDVAASKWTLPPVFKWLKETGNLSQEELLRTFNAGVGMIVVVDPAEQDAVVRGLEAAGETVFRLGEVQPRAGPDAPQVIINGSLD
eukprot:CAMPEP_0206410094 /NCGR_PEP_ID=MMETSP0294-20121207/32359_1 /ASSEMBLY_ACC=CAM_ASM_000327 /TAXON_ID=39354 /ORGANISM="Heterosigma akashiwo, Strain CCMP2393" /LENGTH=1090 /DNA_ID=CAMNT_0053870317 /DNA_START=136 /DNA_END=3409 /DNA_ORIENTATION=+